MEKLIDELPRDPKMKKILRQEKIANSQGNTIKAYRFVSGKGYISKGAIIIVNVFFQMNKILVQKTKDG